MQKLRHLLFFTAWSFISNGQSFYPYSPIPFNKVELKDKFWQSKLEINRTQTIPWSLQQCRITGRIKNFEQAAARSGKFCSPFVFDDSDIYKIIEGASYSLNVQYDGALDHYLDSLIELIGRAQEEDGYLYTNRTMGDTHPWSGTTRYEKEHEGSHELYNVGHLYESAYAHYRATGKMNLLNIATKNANHLITVFGPGRRAVAPGHEVIEIGLVKLYLATTEKKYLDLSQFFIECRGHRTYDHKAGEANVTPWQTGEYWQDHKPVIEQTEAVGHAVRAMYLYSGVADVAALTNNTEYKNAILKIWDNAAGKKTYITGGIGSSGGWEGFGPDYFLPNETAYCETCAGIGSVFWNHRMFMLTGQSKYIDLLERTLYNGILGGVGLDGKSFYYANPMEYATVKGKLSGENKRSPWFSCSCCPSNICRFMPSIPGYMYAYKDDDIYINLYSTSSTEVEIMDHKKIKLSQFSDYPWDGNIKIKLESGFSPGTPFNLLLRIPGWADHHIFPTDLYHEVDAKNIPVQLKINGLNQYFQIADDGYLHLNKTWNPGDEINLILPMPVQKNSSNEKVVSNKNLIALSKGPIMYCAEYIDNKGKTSNLILDHTTNFKTEFEPNVLNGLTTIQARGKAITIDNDQIKTVKQQIHLIPYYARSNRGAGEMKIWLPTKVSNVVIEP